MTGRDEQRSFWRAIAAGQSSEEAALEAGVSQPVGTRLFRKAGGMPPAMFKSSATALSGLVEREEITLLMVQGHSIREIGRRLGRSAATISRELRRNAATRSGGLEYQASTAQWHADRLDRRPKLTKLALNTTLRTYVEERLARCRRGPEQRSRRSRFPLCESAGEGLSTRPSPQLPATRSLAQYPQP
ncbi:hypothetical protein GGD65_008195 [Bradyrhizobium sp. CIR18]|nr:hypothetical protein [Bradyrhizobium sp. CIR18]